MRSGKVVMRQTKILLPTYDVFDEARNFVPADTQSLWRTEGEDGSAKNIALTICEDAWNDKQFWTHRLYGRDPVDELMQQGAGMIVSINGSPFHLGKRELREEMFRAMVRRHKVPAIVVNQVGGNDQIVFDGTSFVMDAGGNVIASAASFAEDLVIADIALGEGDKHANLPDECEAVYEALVLGTRDYIRKCGFERVLIGLSGGIDSSLDRGDCGGRGGAGECSRSRNARTILLGAQHYRRAGYGRWSWDCVRRDSDYARIRGNAADPGTGFRGASTRRHRREYPGSLARADVDVALEQVRLHGSHDRKQERAGRWLLHALRRYVRRPGGDQRSAEDHGLLAFAYRQLQARVRRRSRNPCSKSRRRRS